MQEGQEGSPAPRPAQAAASAPGEPLGGGSGPATQVLCFLFLICSPAACPSDIALRIAGQGLLAPFHRFGTKLGAGCT